MGENFGVNLSDSERATFNSYVEMLKKYYNINNFPVSDEEKMRISRQLDPIYEKLTPEELHQCVEFLDDCLNEEVHEMMGDGPRKPM